MQSYFDCSLSRRTRVRRLPLLSTLSRGAVSVPYEPGVYAVTLDSAATPSFLDHSVGGQFKGKDPTVPPASLAAKWLKEAETLYIGRTKDLRKRVELLARDGHGEAVGHWGGRYLWQLAAHDQLRVGWRPEDDPVAAKRELLDRFASACGSPPFANPVRRASPRVPRVTGRNAAAAATGKASWPT